MSDTAERNLRNVMVLALVDGKLDEAEKKLIDSLRTRMGIDEVDFRRLCAEVREDPQKLSLPTDCDEGVETIRLMVEMAAADGVVTDQENRVLQQLAQKAGLGEAGLEEILAEDRRQQDAHAAEIEAAVDEVYVSFHQWDAAVRRQKFEALGALGRAATIALLRMFESYRKPAGVDTALEMKILLVEQLGLLGDRRAAYYLVQQINLGDMEDEITSTALRSASAEALGKCTGRTFTPDPSGVEAARQWWLAEGSRRYNQLAF